MRPGRAADHSPRSSAAVMGEYSCTSNNPLGHTGPVMGSLNLFILYNACVNLEDPNVDGKITLRWIFRKWDGGIRTGLSWFMLGTGGRLL